MIFNWYPQLIDPAAEADVKRFIKKDLKKHPDLRERVVSFLEKIAEVEDLQPFFDAKTILPLSGGLFEMRIPPRRRGGVVRVYYCHDPLDYLTIILLDAELKHETAPGRTATAERRMKEYLAFTGRRSV